MIFYKDIKANETINTYIRHADNTLRQLGFTEHSFAHVARCATVAGEILTALGYDERTVELGKIAGYMHDIGNVINRIDHAQSGAVMAFRLLDEMGMAADDIARVVSAIGNHDESTAFPVNELAAALILADKSDVRRSRVRDKADINLDIHDRVNYAVVNSHLEVIRDEKTIKLFLTIDEEISHISEYFEIFHGRMQLCRRAAKYFKCAFEIFINDLRVM